MYLSDLAKLGRRALACGLVVSLTAMGPAHAAPSEDTFIKQCNRDFIAPRVQDAMLALKATQYCQDQQFPYTEMEVLARLDKLRCDAGASEMIDELYDQYDKQYRMILTQDKTHTVCKHAATLRVK